MNIYDQKKKIHKIYNDSVYGNIKGDIYKELSDLRIDNDFILQVDTQMLEKRILFKLKDETTEKQLNDLKIQITDIIKTFIENNIDDIDSELREFISGNLLYDSYQFKNNIMIQL